MASVRKARAQLGFNAGALGAQTFALQVGKRLADTANLFVDRSPIEEVQI
jgi:hypothetical protein